MYLDFEDYRPDTPRVPSPISQREGVLLSLVFHLVLVIVYLVLPAATYEEAAPVAVVPEREPVRFVQMAPLIERPAPPRLRPEQSDLDRRSATPVRPREAENPMPFSRGNTPEKTVGAPEEKTVGPETPVPAPPAETRSAPDPAARGLTPAPVPVPRLSGGSLGQSLRNLQQYLRDENFDNQRGGLTEDGPDIQFDAKGVEFGPWLRRFVAQVKGNWFIPQAAMVHSGRVVIQFYIHRNGMITDLRIVAPSGVDAFNMAAFNALRLSNPTIPLPPEYPADRVLFTATFRYNERDPAGPE